MTCQLCGAKDHPSSPVTYDAKAGMTMCKDVKRCNHRQKHAGGRTS